MIIRHCVVVGTVSQVSSGGPIELWQSPSSVMMSELSGGISLVINRVVGEESWELDKFLETLEQELRARERPAVDTPAPQRKPVKIPSSAAALLTGGTDGKPARCYCLQPHYSNLCEKVQSLEEKKVTRR